MGQLNVRISPNSANPNWARDHSSKLLFHRQMIMVSSRIIRLFHAEWSDFSSPQVAGAMFGSCHVKPPDPAAVSRHFWASDLRNQVSFLSFHYGISKRLWPKSNYIKQKSPVELNKNHQQPHQYSSTVDKHVNDIQ